MPGAALAPDAREPYAVGLGVMPEGAFYSGRPIEARDDALRVVRLLLDPTQADAFRLDPNVRYVAPDMVRLLDEPGDPLMGQQWGLARIHATDAWPLLGDAEPALLAYVDSGIDLEHEDLRARVRGGWNLLDGSADASDACGHGTRVAGVLAAQAGNGVGIRGVSQSPLLVFKAFERGASGACEGSWVAAASGVRRAADEGARAISLSLGASVANPAMLDAIAYATAADVVLVAAAGNHGPCADCLLFPASDPRVVAVGAWTEADAPASFSAAGPNLLLMAPGKDVLTTFPGSQYGLRSGTSLATPFVAATAAMMRTANPLLSAQAVRDVLNRTAERPPGQEDPGLLRADLAVAAGLHNLALRALDANATSGSLFVNLTLASQSADVTYAGRAHVSVHGQDGRLLIQAERTFAPVLPGTTRTVAFRFHAPVTCGTYRVSAWIAPAEGLPDGALGDNLASQTAHGMAPDPSGGKLQGLVPFSEEST